MESLSLDGENIKKKNKIKPFLNKYKWDEITFPSEKDNWK